MNKLDITNKIKKIDAIILFSEDIDQIVENKHSVEMLGVFTYLVLLSKTLDHMSTWDGVISFISTTLSMTCEEVSYYIEELKNLGVLKIYIN